MFGAFLHPVHAQETALNYFADGVEAFETGNYEDAIRAFEKAMEIDPENLEYPYYLGLTYARMEQHDKAMDIFRFIVRQDPVNFLKAYFEIAAIYARQGNYDRAIEILNSIQETDPENARAYVEKGYAYKQMGEYDAAIENLQKSLEIDPGLRQMIYYDIGAIYFEMEQFERSIEMFTRAVEVDAGTRYALNAKQAIPNVKAAQRARKPWYFSSSLSMGYDDNVPLDPLEPITPRLGDVRDAGDEFQTFLLRGGYKLLNKKDLELGVGYTLNTIGYDEFTENNLLGHIPHAYLQCGREPLFLRVLYEFSYYYAGADPDDNEWFFLTFGDDSESKLRAHSVAPAISILWPYNLRSDIDLFYQKREYLDGLTPDSDLYSAGIVQSFRVPDTEHTLRAGYKFGYEDAENDEASYRYHEFLLGISSTLYWGIFGDLSVKYMFTDYQNFPVLGDRRDTHYGAALSLVRRFMDVLQLQFYYHYTHNNSNVLINTGDPFKFEKNLFLLSVGFIY